VADPHHPINNSRRTIGLSDLHNTLAPICNDPATANHRKRKRTHHVTTEPAWRRPRVFHGAANNVVT